MTDNSARITPRLSGKLSESTAQTHEIVVYLNRENISGSVEKVSSVVGEVQHQQNSSVVKASATSDQIRKISDMPGVKLVDLSAPLIEEIDFTEVGHTANVVEINKVVEASRNWADNFIASAANSLEAEARRQDLLKGASSKRSDRNDKSEGTGRG